MLEQCSDTCGWIAGVVAAVSFGSFPVPIRFISKVKVDPLVMQSYKSFICFLTCWLVLLLGQPLRFTPWGLVSGLFWVPGATAGIYGIRNAGLAISVGTWSSLIVLSSFCWGIIVFGESVKSVLGAFCGAFVLGVGLVGMSIYSAPVKGKKDRKKVVGEDDEDYTYRYDDDDVVDVVESTKFSKSRDESDDDRECSDHQKQLRTPLLMSSGDSFSNSSDDEENFNGGSGGNNSIGGRQESSGNIELMNKSHSTRRSQNSGVVPSGITSEGNSIIMRRKKSSHDTATGAKRRYNDSESNETETEKEEDFIFWGGKVRLNRRQMGIIGAVINGAWGSNNMIPMHYARKQGFHGAGYLISYSVGSMIITILMWVIRFLYHLHCWEGDRVKAYNSLPSFHIREMWLPGFLSGSLYSLGNFCSIITITALGQGVGYSFVQTSMLVSGLWGIFYFGEVQGFARIWKWIASSCVTIIGILWLSYEHKGTAAH